MISEKTNEIRKQFANDLLELSDDLANLRIKYLGKKGLVTELTSNMASLSIEEKKEVGREANLLRNEIEDKLKELEEEEKNRELEKKLEREKIDVTLPATNIRVGVSNVLQRLIEEVESLYISMGYDVVEGPELEKDLYNFELLNLPKGHPARDAQDTFYTLGETNLLRSQTSPIQIRTMLANKEKTPIRIICPGKTYRRDNDDATHSHQFNQIEGLIVDKDISLADLKGTFDVLVKKLFGDEVESRFRPSYYPFTEPSVEMDISCFNCHGSGCNICKGTGWITIGGAGIVNHKVLDNCGYDSNKWTGFAFGFGAERLAMLKYGITDIRVFYTNDLRSKENFDRKED